MVGIKIDSSMKKFLILTFIVGVQSFSFGRKAPSKTICSTDVIRLFRVLKINNDPFFGNYPPSKISISKIIAFFVLVKYKKGQTRRFAATNDVVYTKKNAAILTLQYQKRSR